MSKIEGLTTRQLAELVLAKKIAARIRDLAYDAQAPYRGDPNTFAATIRRHAEELLGIHKRLLGEDTD